MKKKKVKRQNIRNRTRTKIGIRDEENCKVRKVTKIEQETNQRWKSKQIKGRKLKLSKANGKDAARRIGRQKEAKQMEQNVSEECGRDNIRDEVITEKKLRN